MSLSKLIAQDLDVPESFVLGVARSASYRYKEFFIDKAGGRGKRKIEQPAKELKLLQRWLVRNIFLRLPIHSAVRSYAKGRSIVSNARTHIRAKYISRLDLKDFFPSITAKDIETLLRDNRNPSEKFALDDVDLHLVSSLVCRNGHLTIGAPSSPSISNAILYGIDKELSTIAKNSKAKFTRYADDLYFSASQANILRDVCKKAVNAIRANRTPRLTLNKDKTVHTSRKYRMVVTGIRITSSATLSVGHDLKRKLRVGAHHALLGRLDEQKRMWLNGMLAFVASVEPEFVTKLRRKYKLTDDG